MNTRCFFSFAFLLTLATACAQNDSIVPTDAELISMGDTTIKYGTRYGQQFFLKGSTEPFTGFLCSRYDNGELETVQQFKDGFGQGIWINYDPDGRLHSQGIYRNNKTEGPVTFFYEDGSIKSEGQFIHYKNPIGWWTFYDREGNIVSKRRYTR